MFSIAVTNVNEAPTDIQLSNNTIAENSGPSFVVGSFTATDPDVGNAFTYALVTGLGSNDNAEFAINSGILTLNASADFETKNSYTIRVRVMDAGSLYFERAFVITITNMNEAPSISISQNQSTNEDVPLLNIPVSIADQDGPLTCSASIMFLSDNPSLLPNSSIVRGGTFPNCTISLYPASNKFGSAMIQLKAFDGILDSAISSITLTVDPINDAPV